MPLMPSGLATNPNLLYSPTTLGSAYRETVVMSSLTKLAVTRSIKPRPRPLRCQAGFTCKFQTIQYKLFTNTCSCTTPDILTEVIQFDKPGRVSHARMSVDTTFALLQHHTAIADIDYHSLLSCMGALQRSGSVARTCVHAISATVHVTLSKNLKQKLLAVNWRCRNKAYCNIPNGS